MCNFVRVYIYMNNNNNDINNIKNSKYKKI